MQHLAAYGWHGALMHEAGSPQPGQHILRQETLPLLGAPESRMLDTTIHVQRLAFPLHDGQGAEALSGSGVSHGKHTA